MKVIRIIQHYWTSALACFILLLITACNDNDDDTTSGVISEYESNKNIVRVNVVNMATGLKATFADLIPNLDDRIALTQAMVSDTRFFPDDSGYFFVETLEDATVIAHIYDTWIGTSRCDAQDLNGKYHVQEMIDTVEHIGFGFISYYFTNPATDEPADKLSFVTGIEVNGTNDSDDTDNCVGTDDTTPNDNLPWFIGAGLYNDGINNLLYVNDANKTLVMDVTTTLSEAFSAVFNDIYTQESDQITFSQIFINYIRFFEDQSGYFFILDDAGTVISHGTDDTLEGEDMWNLQDSTGDYFIQGLIQTAQENAGGGFYQYYWANPSTGADEEKTTFIIAIPGTDYFIAAGVYQH
ncbi:cache domain-containing protein [uncultured Shewanella sp.]|uniref:cache domain-containing protein n=1 Tax=uncultured Shewanella sp. TaxID=173975 RepID=UPI00260DD8FC|nr:cache domain-containing protein [uncultured Shewanella sp.]